MRHKSFFGDRIPSYGKIRRWVLGMAAGLVSIHLLAILSLSPIKTDEVAYVCCGMAVAVGAMVCGLFVRRSSGPMRYRWALVTLALAFRCFNYFANAADIANRQPPFLHVSGLWYLSIASGILVFAFTAVYAGGSRLVRLFDLVLVAALCGLRYAVEFIRGGIFPDSGSFLHFLFAGNVFLLVASLIARLAAKDSKEVRFARLMVVYCAIHVVSAFCSNQVGYLWLHQKHGSPWFLAATVGELTFALICLNSLLRPSSSEPTHPPSLLALSVMPFFLTIADVVLGIRLLPVHRSFGIAGIVIALLCYAGRMVFLQIHYIRTQNDLLSRNSHLEGLIDCDPLTGIGNRRSLASALDRHCAEAFHTHQSVYLLLLDVDNFKQANDNFGHVFGDKCLVNIAGALARELKPNQHHLLRYGGDEFAAVVRAASVNQILQIAEYLRSSVEELRLGIPEEPLSVSIGIAAATVPSPAIGSLIETADRALYLAKEKGRNRVEFDLESLVPSASPSLLQ